MRSPYPVKHTNDGMIIGDLSKCRHFTVMLEINDNMFGCFASLSQQNFCYIVWQ
jgi:hypothetical protein